MCSRQIEQLKESYQEKLENTFEMYKDAIKKHAYQSAMNNLEDDYVPLDEFIAEEEKVEVCCIFCCFVFLAINRSALTSDTHCSNPQGFSSKSKCQSLFFYQIASSQLCCTAAW